MTDELLEKAIKISCEQEYPFEHEAHEFSPDFLDKMKALTEYQKPVKYRTYQKLKMRYLLAAILILLIGTTAIATTLSDEKIAKYSERLFTDHTEISITLPKNATTEFGKFVPLMPTYVPENFSLPKDFTPISRFLMKNMTMYSITYTDQDNNQINYTQKIPENDTGYILSDGNPAVKLDIHGYPAYWISNSDGLNTIIYIRADYIFYIDGCTDVKELIKMLESLE